MTIDDAMEDRSIARDIARRHYCKCGHWMDEHVLCDAGSMIHMCCGGKNDDVSHPYCGCRDFRPYGTPA